MTLWFYVIWPHLLLHSTFLSLLQTHCHFWYSLSISSCSNFKAFVHDVSFTWNPPLPDFLMDYFLYSFRCQPKCYLFKKAVLDHTISNIKSSIHMYAHAHSHSSLFLYFIHRTYCHPLTLYKQIVFVVVVVLTTIM